MLGAQEEQRSPRRAAHAHGEEPEVLLLEAPSQAHPERDRRDHGNEVERQKEREHLRLASHVFDHVGSEDAHGPGADVLDEEDRQEQSGVGVLGDVSQRLQGSLGPPTLKLGPLPQPDDGNHDENRDADGDRHREPGGGRARIWGRGQEIQTHRGQHRAEAPQHLADSEHAIALEIVGAELGAEGRMGHREHRDPGEPAEDGDGHPDGQGVALERAGRTPGHDIENAHG